MIREDPLVALIFGASGQDAHYLSEICRSHGITPRGVSRSPGDWLTGDVAQRAEVEQLVAQYQPAYVFHLAANSTTRHSALFENHETIATGTLNILEAVYTRCPSAKVFIAGSGLQFINRGNPISEQDAFDPNSAYSVARIQSVYAARYYRTLGLKVYVGYLFHHDSPLRKPHHVSKMIALAAKRIAAGSGEILPIGDISVCKEWSFAGDIARGIVALVEQNEVFEAAIGSGVSHSIEEWLEQCFRHVSRNWQDHVQLKEGFKPEYSRLISDPATMRSLGWAPAVGMAALAAMMVDASPRHDETHPQ